VTFLLDTNVVSEARNREGDPNVTRWLRGVRSSELFLSVLVIGEIRQGVERLRRRDPAQATVFATWLARLHRDYADRLLPVTTEVAEEWGRLNAPASLAPVDALLAATAKIHGMTLVTRNTADIARTGVAVLNPFDE